VRSEVGDKVIVEEDQSIIDIIEKNIGGGKFE
jgi:hypothetical protein